MIAPDTVTLIQAAQAGDKEACGRLVEENLGLIWSIVKRYTRKTVDNDDLYQLGCLGFLKAVQGFDTQFGTQFSTYAVPRSPGKSGGFSGTTAWSRWAAGGRNRHCSSTGPAPS